MASNASNSDRQKQESNPVANVVQSLQENPTVQKRVNPLIGFAKKFANDWTMNLQAGALAYNLILTIFPILVALLAISQLVLGSLAPSTQQSLINAISSIMPGEVAGSFTSSLRGAANNRVSNFTGPLGIIAILVAIYSGSRLFVMIENCFDLIYQQVQRPFLKKNLIAVGMLLLFAILIPVVILASTIPAFLLTFLNTTFLSRIPGGNVIFSILGILGSLFVSWLLFEAIYIIVPNLKVGLRGSWRGALIAAIGLQLYIALFPFYATRLLGTYAGQVGFAVILVVFFYYFAVILLLGAQVNAFFAEGKRDIQQDLSGIVHEESEESAQERSEKEEHEQKQSSDRPRSNKSDFRSSSKNQEQETR